MENKCHCGYVVENESEARMLELWGCARAIKPKSGHFGDVTIQCCSLIGGTALPPIYDPEDLSDFEDKFKQKYQKK